MCDLVNLMPLAHRLAADKSVARAYEAVLNGQCRETLSRRDGTV
jgi:hypothetical protein